MSGVERGVRGRLGRFWLRGVSRLVPSARRADWLEEWESELWQLRRGGGAACAAVVSYLAGAPASALWELKEEWMTDLWRDVGYGVRTLARSPGFVGVAVLTLALGIGANTVIFTLLDRLLFREPAGLVAPEQLVRIGRGNTGFDNWSYPVYRDFRERAAWFSGVAGFANAGSAIVGRGTDARAVPAQLVSDNYFDVLGVRPALGREFVPEEMVAAGESPVVVISHELWRTRFAADPAAVGSALPINGRDFEVIGVAPAGFAGSDVFTDPPGLWLPATMVETMFGPGAGAMLERRGSSWFWVIARLGRDVTLAEASAATTRLYRGYDEAYPQLAGQGISVVSGVGLRPDERETARRMARLLSGIVLLVLLIACANLAGLALARGAGRRTEVGVRTALGASRARVVRQFLTEAVLVALAGGATAVALTWLVAGQLPALVPFDVSVDFAPDGRVLAFGLATALVAGVVFGLAPALASARSDVRTALSGGGRTVTGGGTRLRRALVALQLALSFVLLAGTGVLLRSVHNAQVVDAGFDADHAAVLTLDLRMRGGYDEEAGRAFYRRLLDDVRAMPGVEAAGLVAELPVADYPSNHTPVAAGETIDRDGPIPPPVASGPAESGYFDAIGLALLAGRTFRESDGHEAAEPVAVINEALARRFFGDADPVGETLPFAADPADEPTRVVGVVASSRNRGLRAEPWAQYWYPWQSAYRGGMTLVVRSTGDPAALLPGLAGLVQRLDPGMPILRQATLRQLVGGTLRETRMISSLIAILGAIALMLAAIGLYGVMAYTVARRTREMGIRIALGARRHDVVGMVLRQGLLLAGVGLLLGLPLALVGLRLLDGLLFGVSRTDPAALAAGAAVLLVAALLAAWGPARRATRVEPVTALREE